MGFSRDVVVSELTGIRARALEYNKTAGVDAGCLEFLMEPLDTVLGIYTAKGDPRGIFLNIADALMYWQHADPVDSARLRGIAGEIKEDLAFRGYRGAGILTVQEHKLFGSTFSGYDGWFHTPLDIINNATEEVEGVRVLKQDQHKEEIREMIRKTAAARKLTGYISVLGWNVGEADDLATVTLEPLDPETGKTVRDPRLIDPKNPDDASCYRIPLELPFRRTESL